MKSKLLTWLLAFVSVMSAQAYDFVDGDFSFNILSEEDATVELAKSTAPSQTNEIYVPSTVQYNGKSYTVVRIGDKAIYQINTQDLAIYIPETITSIGDYGIAACWHLYWIEIYGTEGKLEVGKNFLNSCSEIEYANFCREIVYPEGTTRPALQGKSKMYYCHLGGGVIHDYEFQNCTSLQSVNLSSPITSIGQYAFSNTPKLTQLRSYDDDNDIDFFDTVTSMGEYAFYKCGLHSAVLPKNLITVPKYAFANSNISSAYFDTESKTELIDDNAFYGCTNLKRVMLYGALKQINRYAFDGCTALTRIDFNAVMDYNSTLYASDELLFNATSSSTTFFKDAPIEQIDLGRNIKMYNGRYSAEPFAGMTTLGVVRLLDQCTVLPMDLFSNCTALHQVNFEYSKLEEIGISAFSGCTALSGTLKFPETLKTIRTGAFSGCSKVSYAMFNEELNYIGHSSFAGTGMSVVTIPGKVSEIHTDAFRDCTSLHSVVFEDGTEPIGCSGTLFTNSPVSSLTLGRTFLPEGEKFGEAFLPAVAPFKGNTSLSILNITPGTMELPSNSFNGCTSLLQVEYMGGATIQTIGARAFYNCSSLSEFDVPGSVNEIKDFAFNGCSSLKRIVFAQSDNPIKLGIGNGEYKQGYHKGYGMFYECPIEQIQICRPIDYSSDKYYTDYSPFYGISSINYVSFSDNVNEVGPYLFAKCTGLTNVSLPSSMKSIHEHAFDGCLKLSQVSLSENLDNITGYAFAGCPLAMIYCFANKAPSVDIEHPVFDDAVFSTAMLKIPEGTAITSYNSADVWKDFLKVSTMTSDDLFVHAISLNESEIILKPAETVTLIATILPEDASNMTLTWKSSNEDVALVDNHGKVAALKSGQTTVTATTTDGSELTASCDVKVELLVSSISLSETDIILSEGQRSTLIATVTPQQADNTILQWSSSDSNVVTVDTEGNVIAKNQGTAIISVKSTDGSNISASCNITVVKLVSNIVLNETALTLPEGHVAQLTATVSPALATNQVMEWSSDDKTVAIVDQNGKVTAVSEGTTVITVYSTDGSDISASCKITVVKLVESITLSESEIVLSAGGYKIITATVNPENATNQVLNWTSSNPNVVRVENGIIVAITDGEATITVSATDGSDVTATCDVIVRTLVSEIVLSEDVLELKVGEFANLIASVLPDTATNRDVEWFSSDSSIASVHNGLVLAHSEGEVIVTVAATDGSRVKAECLVTVSKNSAMESIVWDDVRVYVVNSIIHIDHLPSDVLIRVIQPNGSEILRTYSIGDTLTFQPSTKGIYIVMIGTRAFKVAVK